MPVRSGATDDRLGAPHLVNARLERDHGDLLIASNGVGELILHPVESLPLQGIRNLGELSVAPTSGEGVSLLVDRYGALIARLV